MNLENGAVPCHYRSVHLQIVFFTAKLPNAYFPPNLRPVLPAGEGGLRVAPVDVVGVVLVTEAVGDGPVGPGMGSSFSLFFLNVPFS